MKLPVTNILLATCLLAYFPITSSSQPNLSDSAFYNQAIYHTVSVYHQSIGDQSGLLNGRLNAPYIFPFREGSPYFETSKFRNGSVVYDGVLYENVLLLYDELAGLLTGLIPNGRMQFITEKVDRFNVDGSHFIHVDKDSLHPMPTGFYQILYNGKTTVLKKNQKAVREVLESSEGTIRFVDEKLHFYLKKGPSFYLVRSKSELFELLQDHKKEVQQFIKKNGLNVKKDQQNTLVKVAEYYDQLTR